MTDKDKIIKELKEVLDSLDITNEYRLNLIKAIEYLQEEPVSEDLNKAAEEYEEKGKIDSVISRKRDFINGANWQKRQLDFKEESISDDLKGVVDKFLEQYSYAREEVDFQKFALYINFWARGRFAKQHYLDTADLNEAAEKYEKSWKDVGIGPRKEGDYVSIFKEGARWQKEKDSQLPKIRQRDTIDEYAYQVAYDLSNDWAKEVPNWHDVETACKLGAEWQKQQMMKDAVDGVVHHYGDDEIAAIHMTVPKGATLIKDYHGNLSKSLIAFNDD